MSLYGAGYSLVNRYVVHAENPISVHISNMRALTHDAILVLAASGHEGPAWSERPPLPDHLDSYRFTESCASFLGWMLAQPELTPCMIEAEWQAYLTPDASV